MTDASSCRPQNGSTEGPTFVTWPELRALQNSGVVDVQCHTHSHAMICCSPSRHGFATPAYMRRTPMLNRPLVSADPPRFLAASELGAPLFNTRSRMSDGIRYQCPVEVHERCVTYVAQNGGAAFFDRPGWRRELFRQYDPTVPAAPTPETPDDGRRAIEAELDRGRSMLNDGLRTTSVRHICLPWGVSGETTASLLPRLGFRTAIANRMPGALAIHPGDDPLWLKRLPNRYIFRLPGRGRRLFSTS
jgi:hypothetical protein